MVLLNYSDVNCRCKTVCLNCGTDDYWISAEMGWCASCGKRDYTTTYAEDTCRNVLNQLRPLSDEFFATAIGRSPWLETLWACNNELLIALYQSAVQFVRRNEQFIGLVVVTAPGQLLRIQRLARCKHRHDRRGWISLNWPKQCEEIVECRNLREGLLLRARSPDMIGGRAILVPMASYFTDPLSW